MVNPSDQVPEAEVRDYQMYRTHALAGVAAGDIDLSAWPAFCTLQWPD
jgi:hypothetical protein